MAGVIALVAALVATMVLGALWQRRNGRIRTSTTAPARGVLELLGAVPHGQEATIVQFSSAFCQPCVATRRILEQVVGMVEGVGHVELLHVDAESQLDAVRALGILKTPTVLFLDKAGREVKRASGTPRKADVIAVLGTLLPARVDSATPGPLG